MNSSASSSPWRWIYERAKRIGLTLKDAFQRFNENQGAEAAASIAYFALFSLFPLLLLFVFAAGFFTRSETAQRQVLRFVQNSVPISADLIAETLDQILPIRGTVGVIGLVSLLWAATSAFDVLARNVNRAWPKAEERTLLSRRLIALALVGVLALLLTLSLLSTTAANVLPAIQLASDEEMLLDSALWSALSNLVPFLFSFLLFLTLYRWVPNVPVGWGAATTTAIMIAVVWEVLKRGFTWYVRSGLTQYEVIYGSLWTVVVLLFWIFLSSWATLYGAHLCVAIVKGRSRE